MVELHDMKSIFAGACYKNPTTWRYARWSRDVEKEPKILNPKSKRGGPFWGAPNPKGPKYQNGTKYGFCSSNFPYGLGKYSPYGYLAPFGKLKVQQAVHSSRGVEY